MSSKYFYTFATGLVCLMPVIAEATNGMNMEGFGPVSTSMGGASMAYDNGAGAMMNNPATLGLMKDGESSLELAIGILAPDVQVDAGPMSVTSGGDQYVMPAVGWVKKAGQISYGVGLFTQGGMGTEYAADTFMGAGTGQEARSEVGVGRLMAPFAYSVNEQLNIGGSIDYVWGGLDMMMPMPIGTGQPGTFSDFLTGFGGGQELGEATVSAGLAGQIGGAVGAGYDTVAINFSNNSDFSQETSGSGFGAKIGFTYAVNPQLTIGGTYHSKTSMDDWTGDATMVMYDTDGANPDFPVSGKITVKDFQWPATFGFGMAYAPDSNWLLVADIKVLKWSDVMKDFNLVFETGGETADITFYQEWDDQNVVSLGGAYKVDSDLTVRFGANIASNPVPDDFVHPLFPAIIENHYTAGVGYMLSKVSHFDGSMSYAPEVSQTNSSTGMDVSHSQLNWQFMYTRHF